MNRDTRNQAHAAHQPSALSALAHEQLLPVLVAAAPTARTPRAPCRTAAAADRPIRASARPAAPTALRRRSGTPTTTCAAPQMIAMIASVVNAAAVRPAANWPPPPPRLAEVISATAPTPSASVDTPTSVVSRPQTTKRTPTKSTWDCHRTIGTSRIQATDGDSGDSGRRRTDRDADFDAHRRRRRGDVTRKRKRAPSATPAGTETRTGWWNSDSPVPRQQIARLGPRLAAAAAVRTGAAHRHFERHDEAAPRFALRQRHARRAARRRPAARRETRRASVRRRGRPTESRWRSRRQSIRACRGWAASDRYDGAKGSRLTMTANDRSRSGACQGSDTDASVQQESCLQQRMPALRRHDAAQRERRRSSQIPGNPKPTTHATHGNGCALTATTLKKPKRKER